MIQQDGYTIKHINSENIEEALKQSLEKKIKINPIEDAFNEKYATEPAWNKIKNKFSDKIGKFILPMPEPRVVNGE